MTDGPRRPFAPLDEEPEWRKLYEALLSSADFGETITYEALDEVLGRPFRENRSPLYRARREMGDVRKRWLEAVPNIGYRVILADEHIEVANRHRQRAKRQLGLMVHVANVTDLSALSPAGLERFDQQGQINYFLFSFAMQHEQRLRRMEETLRKNGML